MLLARCIGISMMIGILLAATPSDAQSNTLKRSYLNIADLVSSQPPTTRSDATSRVMSAIASTHPDNSTSSLSSAPQSTNDAPRKRTPYSCSADSLVCYDERRGQTNIPLTKSLIPEIPGLTKVGLTVKRSGVYFRYRF